MIVVLKPSVLMVTGCLVFLVALVSKSFLFSVS